MADIHQIIEQAIERYPHSKDLLIAFGPVIETQRRLVKDSPVAIQDISNIDKEKIESGVPVIRQIGLVPDDDLLTDIVQAIACAISKGMPALKQAMDLFVKKVAAGKIDVFHFLSGGEQPRTETGERLDPEAFIRSAAVRVILEKSAKKIAETMQLKWEKGYCPVCGEFPSIALIEEEGGKRFLHCSACGFDWQFTRVVCPYCENEAQQGMTYFYVEDKPQESAFICDKCRKYLVTLYRVGRLFDRDLEVSAISLVHLDILMQQKGYQPMVSRVWNSF